MVKNSNDRWAVLIGINGYHESLGRLKYSVNDCRRLAEVLTTGDDAFPADHVLVLADDEEAERKPTYANIHSWLASWLAQPGEDDTVLVFFAGHGREMDGKCYLVPGDATLQTIHVMGISVSHVQELLNRCKARQKVLILDACHSGAGRDVSTMAAPMMDALSAGKGIYTMTSCDVDEVSHEWEEKAQGVFSYYLAEALSGSCPPDAHGRITAEAVYDWVYDRVLRWARKSRCSQNPKRISNTRGAIMLRKADPDWKALAEALQAKLDVSESAVIGLQEETDRLEARENALRQIRQKARSRIAESGPPKNKRSQKQLAAELGKELTSACLSRDEILAVVQDEVAVAVDGNRRNGPAEETSLRRIEELEREKRGLETVLRKSKQQVSSLSKQGDGRRRQFARTWGIGILGLFLASTIVLGVVGLAADISLLSLIGLSIWLVAVSAFVYVQRHAGYDFRGSLAGMGVMIGLLVLLGIELVVTPVPFLAYTPGVGELVVRSYQQTMVSAEHLFEGGQILEAEKVASELEENLRNASHPELAKVHKGIVAALETKILPKYYVLKGIWEKNGRLLSWDDTEKSAVLLAEFPRIDKFYPSPDGKFIAMLVNDGNQIFVVNRDGGGLLAAVPKHRYGYHLDGWSGPSTLTVTVLAHRRNYYKKKEVTIINTASGE